MLDTAQKLTGIEKASVLLMSIGPLASAKVFEKLSPVERDLLGAEIVKLQHVDSITKQQVVDEVNRHISSHSSVQNEKPIEPIVDDTPFRWLEEYTPEQVVKFIAKERAANVALIAAHLSPRYAADVLSSMDDKLRNQVTHRLASMKPVAKEAVEATEDALRKRIEASTKKDNGCMQRRDTLLKILGGATDRVKDSLSSSSSLQNMPECISSLAEIDSIEDMLQMSDVDIRRVVSEIELGDLLLSLRVASDDLKNIVFLNVSDNVKNILVNELESPAQIMLRDVDAAQQRIVDVLRRVCGGVFKAGMLSEAVIE